MDIRRCLMVLALGICGISCSTRGGRDALGHRPGIQGFRTVVVDAGHGGHDSGAVSAFTAQKEKDLTLDLAHRVCANLKQSGFHTVLIRGDDRFVDLDDRVARANRHSDAVLVSLHFNSGPAGVRGPETYFWRVDSHGLAVRLQQAMKSVSPEEHQNRGLVRRRLRLTRNPEIPCVLLEGGYLSHPSESRLVAQPSYRERLARAITQAICIQSARGDAGTGPLPPPLNEPPSRPNDARE